MTTQTEQLAAIPAAWAQPDPSTICYIPKGGVELAYMGHGEVTLALCAIDPLWTWAPLEIVDGAPVITQQGNRFVMWATLTLCGKDIIGVGTCEAKKFEPEKELIGDFLRNAAMRFGVGTKLWSKATVADPVGADSAGGYEKAAPSPVAQADLSAVAELSEWVRKQTGPLRAQIDDVGRKYGRGTTKAAFGADPAYAAEVQALRDGAAA